MPLTRFRQSYWFHASSGEIEYCKSVIRLLKEKNPGAQVVVTYSSPSAESLFHNIASHVDQFIPLPWDQPAEISRLFDYLQPAVLVFSRTDLWPELIYQARARNIRTGVISYNGASSRSKVFFNRWLLNQLSFISCLNENSRTRLILLTDVPAITADGDTRFDQVFHRLAQPSRLNIRSDEAYIVCGSTWPEDEKVLLALFADLRRQKLRIVLCPHDVNPQNLHRLCSQLNDSGFSFQSLSTEAGRPAVDFRKDILIIDEIGYLADCYREAKLAFVGGSFRQKVHSVMEPLCCGLPVVVGPFFGNNPEAVRYHGRFVFSAKNLNETSHAIDTALALDHAEILEAMKQNKNASEKVLLLITGTAP